MKDAMKKSDDAGVAAAPIRIVVADDHPVVRFGVKNMLENEPGFEVVGEAEDGASALDAVARLRPEVVLLDVQLPDTDGFDVAATLTSNGSGPRVVLTSSRDVSDFGGCVEHLESRHDLIGIDRRRRIVAQRTDDAFVEALVRAGNGLDAPSPVIG